MIMEETREPLVSVVIPSHNRAKLVRRAVESVLGQTYENFECIVVDDASTDETPEVLSEFEDDRFVYHRHETNRHASAARNTGIDVAQGEYIAFLDDDDQWLPSKLEKQVDLIERLPDRVGLVYCWMDYVDSKGNVAREYRPRETGYIFPKTIEDQPIGNSSALLARSVVVRAVEGFDESLPRGNDSDFIRRVCEKYEVDFVPEALVRVYFDHGHERIGTRSEKSIRNFITGQQSILEKFPEYRSQYPREFARVHAKIANYSASVSEWRDAWNHYLEAFRLTSTDPYVYSQLIRSLAKLLWRKN